MKVFYENKNDDDNLWLLSMRFLYMDCQNFNTDPLRFIDEIVRNKTPEGK